MNSSRLVPPNRKYADPREALEEVPKMGFWTVREVVIRIRVAAAYVDHANP
jgi:hypothetical protein